MFWELRGVGGGGGEEEEVSVDVRLGGHYLSPDLRTTGLWREGTRPFSSSPATSDQTTDRVIRHRGGCLSVTCLLRWKEGVSWGDRGRPLTIKSAALCVVRSLAVAVEII